MKKYIFIMPLMAVSLLASCNNGGGDKPEPSVVYHTITFHSNGGTEVPVLKVEDGKLAVEPKDPTKDTFVFAGWYEEETLDNYLDFPKTPITRDYDLYARWEANYEYSVTLDCDNKLTLETDKGFLNQKDYTSKITLNSNQIGKYDIPEAKGYYQVTVNGRTITDFTIEKVEVGVNTYHVNITIPKEQLGDNIVITTTPYTHYVSFTAVEAGATIYYDLGGPLSPSVLPKLKFCTDLNNENWSDWTFGEEGKITFSAVGETIYVKNTLDTFSESNKNVRFWTNKKISASGNIMSLVNFAELSEGCFWGLFSHSSLTTSPILPATVLSPLCYANMFNRCASLTTSPILPATALQPECYYYMFGFCDILSINDSGSGTKFFTCPSDISPEDCVSGMFEDTGGDFKGTPVANTTYYYE